MGSKTSPTYARFLNALLLLAAVVLLLLGYVGAVTWMGVAVSSGARLVRAMDTAPGTWKSIGKTTPSWRTGKDKAGEAHRGGAAYSKKGAR